MRFAFRLHARAALAALTLGVMTLGPLTLAGCDGTSDDTAEAADALGALSPTTAVVVRAEGGAAGLGGIGGDSLGTDPDDLFATLGIDPDDVSAVFVASGAGALGAEGPVGDDADAGAVVLGRFDVDAITDGVGSTGTYRGARLFAYTDGATGTPSAGAVTRGALYAAPTAAAVRAMLDRRAGEAPSLGDDRTLVRLAGRLDGEPIGLLLADPSLLFTLLAGGSPLPLVLPIDAAAVTFEFGGTDDLALEGTAWLAPTDGTRAAALVPLLQAAVALAAAQSGLDESTRAVLTSLAFRADGPDVRMTFEVPLVFEAALARLAAPAVTLAR